MFRTTLSLTVLTAVLTAGQAAQAQNKFLKQVIAPQPQVIGPQFGQPGPVLPPGQGAPQTKQLILDPTQPNQLAYFSPRLGARFLIEKMYMPQFGYFWGARIVSQPEWGSPLRQIGLGEGDVITRLDGVPVMNTNELERHILDTGVRSIKAGHDHVHRQTIYVNPNKFFQDPYAVGPWCPHDHGLGPWGNVAVQP
jgi:hypothetical protein